MADAKISQLPVATTPLAGTELVPVVQGGVTVQTTTDAILTGTVPSGTANGVLYLNGSKVVTSGSGLVFDGTNLGVGSSSPIFKIDARGASGVGFSYIETTTGNANRIQLGAGSGIGYINATAGSGSPSLQFQVADLEQMRLTSTGLGIGTNNPQTKLDVELAGGMVRFGGASGNNLSQVYTSSGATGLGMWAGGVSRLYSTNTLTFCTNATLTTGIPTGYVDAMTLDSSGNLGLGVTPSAWGSGWPALQVGSRTVVHSAPDGRASFGGNYYVDGTNAVYIASAPATQLMQVSGEFRFFTAPSGTAGNAISFTQAMTLDASGRLLIGTTSNLSGEPLQIDGNGVGSTVYTALIRNTSTSTSVYNMVRWGQNATGSAVGYIGTGGSTVGNPAFQNTFVVGTQTSNALVFNTNDAERARIPAAGGMVIGTAALATTATDGFMYVPTCAGTPTGTPTTQTGTAPIVVDTTNNKLYFYSGGQWRDAGP